MKSILSPNHRTGVYDINKVKFPDDTNLSQSGKQHMYKKLYNEVLKF